MSKIEVEHTEKRWAIVDRFGDEWRFLGKHCWPFVSFTDARIRTFRTRKEARTARKALDWVYAEARIVPIDVTVKIR